MVCFYLLSLGRPIRRLGHVKEKICLQLSWVGREFRDISTSRQMTWCLCYVGWNFLLRQDVGSEKGKEMRDYTFKSKPVRGFL